MLNSLPMLVLTFLLYGGLNHITFLRHLRCCVGGPCGGGLNSSLYVYPLFLSASWYGGAASLKTFSSDEMLDIYIDRYVYSDETSSKLLTAPALIK